MKLFRHGAVGAERAGALDGDGRKRDLSLLVPDITPEWLSPEKLAAIAAIDLKKLPLVPEGARIGAPVGGARQFVAIGLNYGKHAAETGAQPPKEPIVFNKAITCMQGPNDDVRLPEGKILVPGVVTHSTDVVEHPELVAQRIERFASVVGPENVIAGTDCGFGGRTHPQIAWAKLRSLSEGAARASRALGLSD